MFAWSMQFNRKVTTVAAFILLPLQAQTTAIADSDRAVIRIRNDSLVKLAQAAIAEGRPWRATEILTPVVNDTARRTPTVAIVAARAASGWNGWREVERILIVESWLDTLFEGEGRWLLARSQLETGRDSLAAINARLALDIAANDSQRGVRTVLLARSLAAIKDAAGAAAYYQEAARLVPAAADWLNLRAAEWLADSAARRTLLATLVIPHAVSRGMGIDALASENTGDTTGAIQRYVRAGDLASAFRLRLAFARSASDSTALRADIVAAVGGATAAANRAYIELFDAAFRSTSAEENLAFARALGFAGGARSADSYEIAFRGGAGNDNDRYSYATLLARLGRNNEAIAQFERVKSPPALAAAAAYQRARTMLRTAQADDWREALRSVVREYPTDTSAATALYLLADLATDEGRDSAAREAFLSSARRFPRGSRAPVSFFNAAMIAYVFGDFGTAATEFAHVRNEYPQSAEATPSTYWRGRALAKAGDTAAIGLSCARIRATDSLSYYAALCTQRGHDTFRLPVAAVADTFISLPDIDSIAARVRVLRDLSLEPELILELDRIRTISGPDAERTLSAANTLRSLGYGSRAISLAQLAQSRGAPRDARLFRLLYPSTFLDMVRAEAAQYQLDVDMLAGLIRQESLFNPAATSPAGARGLMQVMPALGGDLARAFGFPVWDPVLLWQPDVNARLGTKHFADLIGTQSHVYHVLASYNAGSNRVERWLTKAGTDDPEVFVERIPFVETRDYVRIVTRNRETYRALYGR